MESIEFEKWKPSEDDPRKLKYAGQRTAQEVFEELRYRLESTGYLPEKYFLLDRDWENGREIPKDADIFCTTDYGGSEGVYLDVYLKWYEEHKSITKRFITGKTLGENGNDLDRMFLISSAITKAFHGDHATHARYMKLGGVEDDTGGAVVHLSQQEQHTIVTALVEQRERQEEAMTQTEQLLRRMTGSITAYINEVGMRPLRMSDYDKAVLAIRDGEWDAFREYAAKVPYQQEQLLIEAAGRPGTVGRRMTELLMEDRCNIDYGIYHEACKKAIDIDDPEKVLFMLDRAQDCVEQLPPSFHGEMASYAYLDHRFIAKQIIHQCGEEQITAAPSRLLEQFAADHDYRTLSELVEKGISGGSNSARTLHMLTSGGRDSWMAEGLLEKRMWVDVEDYNALHACVRNNAVAVCGLLLEGGMDFQEYQAWREAHSCVGNEETMQALTEHWQELKAPEQQDEGPVQGEWSLANLAVTRAALALSDERTRKGAGWALVCVLSPLILLAALLCSLGSGASSHNVSVVEWCFHGGALPPGIPEEYAAHMEDMRGSFALLDACIADIQEMAEGENGLDDIRIKAIFYALYFGADSPSGEDHRRFADCFVSYEERTRIVTSVNEEGEEISAEEIYTVAVPIEDLAEIYQKIGTVMGLAATDEQKANADSIYNLIRYGTAGGAGLGGSDAPFIGADGFCSPVGENWRSIITSEFGYRKDPFTGKTKGHGGMDLAVPTGTSVRAALPGTVTVSQYSSSYGYYVMIDHGGGLATLYAHNSKLLVKVGQTVEAGDIVSLSGSTGRSTGPHLHFEVRVNGERTNPRSYLP